MSEQQDLYQIPKSLDAPTRIVVFTLDEFVPMFMAFVLFSCFVNMIVGMMVSAALVLLIKMLKQGQGSAWLMNVCYWYFPSTSFSLSRYTPNSCDRHYVA